MKIKFDSDLEPIKVTFSQVVRGPKGDPGRTPVRGVDYWTDEDIATIKGYVEDAILGGEW